MTTRREWLEQTAATAAVLGLPSGARTWLSRPGLHGERRYLNLALRCAEWISASEQKTAHGAAWPADPLKPESVGLDFYNGMPGVVVFLAELYRATDDARWLRAAESGANHIVAEMERREGRPLDAGLYTGLGGFAFTFMVMDSLGRDGRYRTHLNRALTLLGERAQPAEGGLHWNGSHDIISGNAGIGLLLLEAHRRTGEDAQLELAKQAGSRLIAAAERSEGGLMWFPSATLRRNLPNFSHGTAGVAYFLAALHERTREQRFLDAALRGARYLDAIATRKDGATVIRHHDGEDGVSLFYLSWCHGPAGTARLFYKLHQITGETQWLDWVESLTRGILTTGIPEQRTAGFWNNISQCCGNIGVGQYFLDLSIALAGNERQRGKSGKEGEMIRRVVDDTLSRATSDSRGISWVQAEHRVQPENLVAQTGFMQGAAGVGTFFLRLDAVERGAKWSLVLPDSPFGA